MPKKGNAMRATKTGKCASGFTLIESIVIIFVLSIISAIGLSAFLNVIYAAQKTAANHSITNFAKNCGRNRYSSLSSVPGYEASSSSCNDIATQSPSDPIINPKYVYDPNTNKTTCYAGSIKLSYPSCTISDKDKDYLARKQEVESSPLVQSDTYFERGCSGYAIVDGPSWSQAQANAQKLGGNLLTINDEEENIWVHKTFIDIGVKMPKDRFNTRHIFIGLKRGGGTGQQVTNSAGYSDGWISGEDATWRPKYWGKTGEITDPDGNVQGTNLEGHQGGADYGALVVMDGFNTAPTTPGMTWNDFPEWMHNQGKGLVEIPVCK